MVQDLATAGGAVGQTSILLVTPLVAAVTAARGTWDLMCDLFLILLKLTGALLTQLRFGAWAGAQCRFTTKFCVLTKHVAAEVVQWLCSSKHCSSPFPSPLSLENKIGDTASSSSVCLRIPLPSKDG